MNLPNKLTMMRVVLVPVFMIFAAASHYGTADFHAAYMLIAGIIFAIASITDFLDGYLARKNHLVTDFGKFMDPLADKMLVMAAMCYFVECGQMPGWCLAIVLLREFAVSGMRLVAVEQGRVIAAAWSGKVKTASTMVCLCLMLVFQSNLLNVVCIAVIVATTVYSGIEYFAKNLDVFKEAD
mgnify:CR=1 FL=1